MKRTLFVAALTLVASAAQAQGPGAQPAIPTPAEMAGRFMQNNDADKNGTVSKAEFMKPMEDEFKSMDANGDGQLDKAEVEKFATGIQQRMEQARAKAGQAPQPAK